MDAVYLVGYVALAIFVFIAAIILFNFFNLWLRAKIAGAPVGMGKMVGMRLRKVPVGLIVDNRITAVKAGIDIPSDPLEAHYLAGGKVSPEWCVRRRDNVGTTEGSGERRVVKKNRSRRSPNY